MFGKKAKEKAIVSDTVDMSAKEVKDVKSSKKVKRPVLAKFFRESVWETVQVDLMKNEAFIMTDEGQTCYIAIALNVNDIGGITKKSVRDEAKGQIVELINKGNIKAYLTLDFLEDNMLVFIPEPKSMAAMEEFSLLTNAPYQFCSIHTDGSTDMLGIPTTYKEVSDIIVNNGSITDLLGDSSDVADESVVVSDDDILDDMADDSTQVDDTDLSTDEEDVIPELDDNVAVDDVDDVDDIDNMEGLSSIDDEMIPSDEDVLSVDQPMYQDDVMSDASVLDEPQMDEPEVDLPYGEVERARARTFCPEDLSLKISTDAFDAQFAQDLPYVLFETDRPSNWLNDNLNEMCRQANVQMIRAHNEAIFSLRNDYFKLMSRVCERITDDLDLNRDDTIYGPIYQALLRRRDEEYNKIPTIVSDRKDEIEQGWISELQNVGLAAAREAQSDYMKKYGSYHESKLAQVEKDVRLSIDVNYEEAKAELMERRRMESQQQFEVGVNEVLKECSNMYDELLQDEYNLYTQLNQQIIDFVENNRANDITRANVLSEQLRQSEAADRVLAEQTQKMQSMRAAWEDQKRSLMSDIEHLRETNQQKLDAYDSDLKRESERHQKEVGELKRNYDTLLEKYETTVSEKDKKYDAIVREKDSAYKDLEQRINKKSKITWFILVASIMVCLGLGFILGTTTTTNRQIKMQNQMLNEVGMDVNNTESTEK